MSEERIKIKANSVQETLVIPLYGRKLCAEKFPELYQDPFATELCARLDYDFSKLDKNKDRFLYEFGALEAAMRQIDIKTEIEDYLAEYPEAAIVNLGCGLDQTGRACDNGQCRIYNIDLPDIITIRNSLLTLDEREENIACDLTDHSWIDQIDASQGVVLFAAGVFHYFTKKAVRELVLQLAYRFGGGRLIFDSVGRLGLLLMSGTLAKMDIKDVSALFYVNEPKWELAWSTKIDLRSTGYMLGYHDMRSPGVSAKHRLTAKFCDQILKMRINRMDFIG